MHAHTPPFTKPTGAYDARKLYEETGKIAAAQDTKLDPVSDTESKVRTALSYLHHAQLLLKEAFPSKSVVRAPKWSPKWLDEQVTIGHAKLHGIAELAELVAESQKLGLYDDPIPAESAYLASFSPNGSRIATSTEIDAMREVLTAEELKGFGIGDVEPRHPMHAEALRDEYEKGDGETGV